MSKPGQELEQQQTDAALVEKMSQPIDVKATYTIEGQAIVGIMQLVDEIPMKYARQLVPAILGSLERNE